MWVLAIPFLVLQLPEPVPEPPRFVSPTFAVKPCELMVKRQEGRHLLRLCVSPKAQGGGMYIREA